MRPRGPAISHTPTRRTKRRRSRTWRRRLAPIAALRPEKIGTPSTLPRNAKPKPSKRFARSQGGHRSADGRSCAGEGSHRPRAQGKDRGGDRHQEPDRGSGGAKARRVVHPAPLRRRPRLSAATRRSSPPIRNGRARRCCAGARRRGCGSSAAMRRRFAASLATGPTSAKGKLALARVLLAEGDRDGAARLARDAWRSDELSERLETDSVRDVPRSSQSR